VTLPPSVLRLFSAEEVTNQALPALQTVISAGEACTPDLVANWSSGRSFINAYGPTETTVCASMYRCSGLETEPPPIGRPIANTRVYILDKHQQPVPVNVPGELHVSGISLAVGYRNQPELTAEKFIQNPFKVEKLAGVNLETSNLLTSESFKRLYRTGDLARYRADGNIEFLGRIDQQVKVRGFRIELGEIESALSNHPALKDVAVIAQDLAPADAISTAENSGSRGAGVQAEKRLVAFVVPEAEHAPEVSELRAFLRQTLPEYMVPSAFVFLAELPLSPSGKIDRKVLAKMQAVERPDLESAYTAPRNQTEERLVQISSELLHLDRVGVYDNFFELGGHSLLATQFVSRVRDEFGIELPLRKLFENPTIAGIAAVIEEARIAENEQQAAGGETARASKAADRAKLLEMLQRIGDLSPDEVKALLELKRRSEE
jgi:acyl carrier protein